jgi:hypothetical protein
LTVPPDNRGELPRANLARIELGANLTIMARRMRGSGISGPVGLPVEFDYGY